ncbi:hypothetical protein P154DRAFT_536353 [Amniculicola lignicola CBS 123094]|uniref:Rhodopsin domain-containing protein n=1 Tax=Amniculicola lignicola CBS 123094 TaxID=1392246 RepID=A0A6A5W9F5_9PLEO|nr:hypothetical protein P154DRAFT_536353 [Amniculicola lignicola CBS 123094]
MTTPEERAHLTFAIIVTLLVLGWLTVILRFWVRLRITKSPGWDDATMLLTLILFTCYCGFILAISAFGALKHKPTRESLIQTLVYIQLGEIFYVITTTALKISLGLFFLRVLTKRWQINIFYVILYVSGIYGLFYTFIAIFQCGAPDKLLQSFLGTGNVKCLPSWFLLSTGYIYGSINVIADWTFVLIPIFILLDSDMDRSSKISVSIVMGLGAIGSISSILRMVYLKGLLLNGNAGPDSVRATIWATAEPGTGIIAANIAILRPLFRAVTSEVRYRISDVKASRTSKSGSVTNMGGTTQFDDRNDDTIALTSVISGGKGSKKKSIYSIPSPTWAEDVERAQIAKVMHIGATSMEAGSPMSKMPPTAKRG